MPRFNFSDILMDAPEVAEEYKVSITSGGQMLIPRSTWAHFGLENAAVKVQWDPQKRALALKRILTEYESTAWDKRTMRKLEINTTNKSMRVPLGRILKPLGLLGHKYNSITMDKYVDRVDDQTYYYVILPKQTNAPVRDTAGVEAPAQSE